VGAFFVKEQLDHRSRGNHAELARVELAGFAQDFAQDVVAHAARRFDAAFALAGGAGLAQHVGE